MTTSKAQVARALGMDRTNLYKLLEGKDGSPRNVRPSRASATTLSKIRRDGSTRDDAGPAKASHHAAGATKSNLVRSSAGVWTRVAPAVTDTAPFDLSICELLWVGNSNV
jgi:hypothetical protein